jgi:hypothetical protein
MRFVVSYLETGFSFENAVALNLSQGLCDHLWLAGLRFKNKLPIHKVNLDVLSVLDVTGEDSLRDLIFDLSLQW